MPEARRVVRIVTADDHEIFRDGLRRLLESEPGFRVVGEAASGTEAVRLVQETTPDVLLLDLAMPASGGIEALRTGALAQTRVIILTAALEPGELVRAVRLGHPARVTPELHDHTLDLLVDASELARRREGWTPNPARYTSGVLGKYARLAQGAEKGAITNLL